MAQEYFLYRTDFNNTIIDRSNTSFAPLSSGTSEIFIDFLIPNNQPLYYYRESGGTIVINDESNISDYESQFIFTGSTLFTIPSRKFFAGKLSSQNITSSFLPITGWSSPSIISTTVFDFNTSTGELTFKKDGFYDIDFYYSIDVSAGTARSVASTKLQENISGTYADVPFSRSFTYNRQDSEGETSASVSLLRPYTIGDKIRIVLRQESGSDTLQLIGGTVGLKVIKSEISSDPNEQDFDFDAFSATTDNRLSALELGTSGGTNVFYGSSRTNASGIQLDGFNLNVSKGGTGVYNYTFETVPPSANYSVFAQPINTVTDTNAQISNITSNGFTVSIGVGDNGGTPDTLTDTEHSVGVFGVPIVTDITVGVTNSNFTGYTASTETRLQVLESTSGGTADGVVSGATLSGSNLILNRTQGLLDVIVDLSPLSGGSGSSADGVVSGATLSGSDLILSRTESLPDITVDLSSITGTTLSITDFNTYTGTTDSRITTNENDIIFLSGQTDNKLNTSDFNTYTGTTDTRISDIETDITFLSGVTDQKLDISGGTLTGSLTVNGSSSIGGSLSVAGSITENGIPLSTQYNSVSAFTGYTASTDSALVNIFTPLDGINSDDSRFEAYASEQLLRGQPIYFHDPSDLGFVFTGLSTGNDYNILPWIGINGGGSAPRLKLFGTSTTFTTAGIRGVELFIENGSDIEVLGLSEHASIDLTEIRFDTGSPSSLTLRAVNLTVGRVEGQTVTDTLNIRDRSNIRIQNLNEVNTINVEGGCILEVNWFRLNSVINIGTVDGTTPDSDPCMVTIARGQNLTSGNVNILGDYSILKASSIPITVFSGATKNTIIGANNTITDNGVDTIIVENLSSSTFSGITQSEFDSYTANTNTTINNIESDISFISGVTDQKLDTSDFNSYTASTDSTLTNYENRITFLESVSGGTTSGVTQTEFNSYTANTETRLVDIESNKLDISGGTITGDLEIEERLFLSGTSANTSQLNDAFLAALDINGQLVKTTTPALNVSEQVTDITGNTVITNLSGIYYVDTSSGNVTLEIPDAAPENDVSRLTFIKRTNDNNLVQITTTGGTQNIGDATTQSIGVFEKGITIVSDADNGKWLITVDSRFPQGDDEGTLLYWDDTDKVWKATSNDVTWDNTELTFTVGGNSTPPTFQIDANDDIVYINTTALAGLAVADDLGFYAGGRGAFGNSVNITRLRGNTPSNQPRSLSLIDTNSTFRIWRFTDLANQDPAIEFVWGDQNTPSSGINKWWDIYLAGETGNNDSLNFRRRTGNNNVNILRCFPDNISMEFTTNFQEKINLNSFTNTTVGEGDIWYDGTSLLFNDGTNDINLLGISVSDNGTNVSGSNEVFTNIDFGFGINAVQSGDTVNVSLPAALENKLQLIDSAGGQDFNSVTPVAINWGQQDIIDTNVFSHTAGNSTITVNQTGLYEISYNINGDLQANNRATVGIQIRRNGTVIDATLTANYVRNNNNNDSNNTLPPYLISLNTTDTIDVIAFRLGDNNSVLSKANASFLRINYLG